MINIKTAKALDSGILLVLYWQIICHRRNKGLAVTISLHCKPQPQLPKLCLARGRVTREWTALDGVATLEAMSSHCNFRPAQQSKLVSDLPIDAPDEHAQLVEADQRFQAALDKAIATGRERIAAVEATVQLKRRSKLSP